MAARKTILLATVGSLIGIACSEPSLSHPGGRTRQVVPIEAKANLAADAAVGNSCPKILMFDGLEIHHDTNEQKARYWGKTIGIDGFFLNNVMYDWQDSVGIDPHATVYKQVSQFERLFSQYGVADNFIKVRCYRRFNWLDSNLGNKVVTNFRNAANLAKYAGLRGIALDLEPTYALWSEEPGVPDKNRRAHTLGRQIGAAIDAGCPACQLIVLPEVVVHQKVYSPAAYRFAPSFWQGLLEGFPGAIEVATESTYSSVRPDEQLNAVRRVYTQGLAPQANPSRIHFAAGLWPLGKSYADKSARMSAAQFPKSLQAAMASSTDYVWIYGAGSAWENDGAYGKGKVDPRFSEFISAIHEAKRGCGR